MKSLETVDTYEVSGETYTAKEQRGCAGCYFESNEQRCNNAPLCSSRSRTDGRSIVWVKLEGAKLESHTVRHEGLARLNDPETSKTAAKIVRTPLRNQIIERMRLSVERATDATYQHGWTGEELAEALSAKLNSITPRFAELRDQIQDSGRRRGGQIVWVLKYQ